MKLLKSIHLRPDEKIIKIVHPHWLAYFWWHCLSFILIVTPFFFMFWLFSWGQWGTGLFIAPLLLGVYFLFRAIFLQYYNALIITTGRLINLMQLGAWDRQVGEVSYEHIRQVTFQIKGLLRTIFKYGLVKVETDGRQTDLIFDRLPRPFAIQEIIVTLQNNYNKQSRQATDSSISLLEQINTLSPDELRKLAGLIEAKRNPTTFRSLEK